MLAVTDQDLARFATALKSAIGWPIRLVLALKRQQAHRAEYRRMLQMSDHDLSDIGLTRDDIRAALSEPPYWDDAR
ncbi:MAG: DUF1127 domain-containing protein [Pseudomonadota bacterium]